MSTLPSAVEIVRELVGNVCRCGRAKVPHRAFCGACYKRLPEDLQRDLYRKVGQGFEGAYHESIKQLGIGDTAPAKNPPVQRSMNICMGCGVGRVDVNPACPMHGAGR